MVVMQGTFLEVGVTGFGVVIVVAIMVVVAHVAVIPLTVMWRTTARSVGIVITILMLSYIGGGLRIASCGVWI